jgi:hypothetical protein
MNYVSLVSGIRIYLDAMILEGAYQYKSSRLELEPRALDDVFAMPFYDE